jgi:S-DNA-T family DNA segregation ATPase FtsK/SpoIIIE
LRVNVTVESSQEQVDLLVDADDALTVGALAAALSAAVPGARGEVITERGSVQGSTTLAEAGLLEGMSLGLGAPPPVLPSPSTRGWQLHVVSGPDCGGVFELPIGAHEIGRGAAIGIADNAMSRMHARIVVEGDRATVEDVGSSNGTFLDGQKVEAGAPVPITLGQVLVVGDSHLVIRAAVAADGVTEPAEPGWLHFLRPPRLLAHEAKVRIEVPEAPRKPDQRRFPMIMMVAPLVMGAVMYLAIPSHPVYMLLMCLMSPVMMGANYFGDRRENVRRYAEDLAEYEKKVAAADQRLATSLSAERARLRDDLPDAAATYLTACLPGRRLWERRRHDADAYRCRVGTADLGSSIELAGRDVDDISEDALHAVPVALDIREAGVVGVAGVSTSATRLAQWLVVQLGTYHAPRDLGMSLLTASGNDGWRWVRWMPHFRTGDLEGPTARVGNDPQTVADQVAWMLASIKARKDAQAENRALDAASFPAHVVVIDGYRDLRTVQGLAQVLDEGPRVGVYAICVDEAERFLPDRCTATVVFAEHGNDQGVLRRSGHKDVTGVDLEGVGSAWCDRIARKLAPLIDMSTDGDESTLPDSVRLLDVVQMDPPDPTAIRARWALAPADTEMTIGMGMSGPFTLDLAKDGPHGLIAGMTGAGKTELLQTMLASLALANRPDSMNFVLVDYKGDSAFKDCVRLPHTVGKVNDLDPHLVERALASLGAELKYREHFFAEAQVKDIDDYRLLQAKEPHRKPLPRLLLVIDEFAALVKELPDFVTGLVGIAQRGRSLGVHLLLATQRPGGVVSPEIRANTNMRLSLRVAESAESVDVINSPDAAKIAKSTPGRGYARLGEGALVPFQSGRVGGRRPGAVAVDLPEPLVARISWPQLGYAAPQRAAGQANEDVADTDLASLVAAVCAAAAADGVPAQRQPWLPALPEDLTVDQVYAGGVTDRIVPLPYGLMDLPADQLQVPATFDMEKDGHLLVIGMSRVGRSQVLRTLAGAVARLSTPDDVHLYGLDCGNGALNQLTALPHCGAVVQRNEVERATRLLLRLCEEMDARQRTLSQGGFTDVTEQRAAGLGTPLPHLLVLLDRWEGFTGTLSELDNGALNDAVLRILREGASLGVHLVITGDRSLAIGRIASMTESKLAMRLAEKIDYSMLGLSPSSIPDSMPAGRGFLGSGAEVQVALLDPDASGQGQARALTELGEQARASMGEQRCRPFRLDVLPARIDLETALAHRAPDGSDPFALVGVGGDELTALGPDLTRGGAFVVAGPTRSGKSSALLAMSRSWIATGGQVVVVAPRSSPLRDLAGARGVLGVIADGTTSAEDMKALVESSPAPVVVMVDDGEGLRDTGAAPYFLEVLRGATPTPVGLVLAGDADGICGGLTGWQVEAKKSRQGLLLSPQGFNDGDLVGLRLSRSALGQPVQPGLGWLHLGDGNLVRVAVPIAD